MSENQANIRILSLKLSRQLKESGLDESSVRRHRKTFLFCENIGTMYYRIIGDCRTVYIFGSQSEGTTTAALSSDTDTLVVNPSFRVLQDPAEWRRDVTNLLMLTDDTAPGYCRLQLLRPDSPEPVTTPPDSMYPYVTPPSKMFAYDSRKRVVLSNKGFDHLITDKPRVRSGPSSVLIDLPKQDLVLAIKSQCRLRLAEKWARRNRRASWPSQDLVKQVVSAEFLVVPVGHKLSPSPHLEWRISTSLAERYLMFSLNIVQIKCYVTLKHIFKKIVTRVGKCITSYHCKTAILYCMENTEADFWREDNLLENVTRCLMIMLDWIRDLHCPHYIMPECNLFAGKVTLEHKTMLQSVIKGWIEAMRNRAIFNSSHNFGFTSASTIKLTGYLETRRQWQCSQADTMILSYIQDASRDSVTAMSFIKRTILMLRTQYCDSDYLELRESVEHFVEFLSCLQRSICISAVLSSRDVIPEDSSRLLDTRTTLNIAYKLKQAAVLFCNKEFRNAEMLLEEIDSHTSRNTMQPICGCLLRILDYSTLFCRGLYSMRDDNARESLFAPCVKFISMERGCMPRALQYELFRAARDDVKTRNPDTDRWMVLAVADCLPLLYFLQYITYRELGNRDLRKRSLDNLSQCTRDESLITHHRDTAYNLLGQCYELEQQPNDALQCYKKSLDVRPRNNAANWLVTTLLFRQLEYSKLLSATRSR